MFYVNAPVLRAPDGGANWISPSPSVSYLRVPCWTLVVSSRPCSPSTKILARRWSGHWDQVALHSLTPMIAKCTRKQIKAVLGHVLRVTRATTSACWRQFLATARELSPPPVLCRPPPPQQIINCPPSTGTLARARTTANHGSPIPMLRRAAD